MNISITLDNREFSYNYMYIASLYILRKICIRNVVAHKENGVKK